MAPSIRERDAWLSKAGKAAVQGIPGIPANLLKTHKSVGFAYSPIGSPNPSSVASRLLPCHSLQSTRVLRM